MPDEDININVENQDSSGSPPIPPATPEPQPVPSAQPEPQPVPQPAPPPQPQPAPPPPQPEPAPPQPEQTIRPEQPVETESVMEVPPQEPQEEIPVPGRPMTDQTPPPSVTSTKPVVEKSGSFLKVLFGIVAFLGLIGVGVWAYLNFVVAPVTENNVEVTIPPVVTTPQSTMSVFSIERDLDEFENELADLEKELETEFDLDIEIPDF